LGVVVLQTTENYERSNGFAWNEGLSQARALEVYRSLSHGISVQHSPELGHLVRASDVGTPIQRWFQYREGYTLELCNRIFSHDESLVVDPFCGFGSTLVAARRRGFASVGIDANPLAAFVAKAKTQNYSQRTINDIKTHIGAFARVRSGPRAEVPLLRIIDKIFHPEILDALLCLQGRILAIANDKVRDFLLLGWIAILEDVSNVFREGNGIKYRNRIRNGNTYTVNPYQQWAATRFPEDKFQFVKRKFISQLNLMLEDIQAEKRSSVQPVVKHGDAEDLRVLVPPEGASLALFSPPYCNCFNYIKAYKVELWMSGFIRTYADIGKLTALGIRSRVESVVNPVVDPYPEEVDSLIELMDPFGLWSAQLPEVIKGYFADMRSRLAAVHSILRGGGRCAIVVGNSAYAGVIIPSDLLLARTAEKVGFKIERIDVCRHLTTSSQQRRRLLPVKELMRESVVHLVRA
jgi:SAM-dependent methyltransferase